MDLVKAYAKPERDALREEYAHVETVRLYREQFFALLDVIDELEGRADATKEPSAA